MISVKHFRNFEFDFQSAASESACIGFLWEDNILWYSLPLKLYLLMKIISAPYKNWFVEKWYINN